MPHDNNDKYEVIYGVSETPQVLIDCQVSEQNNTFTCHLDIRDNAFDTKFINAFIDEFQILLHEYAKDIKQWENESYFVRYLKKHCKTSPPQNKIEDIDKRLSTLKLVDHSHTLKVNNDKNKHLKHILCQIMKFKTLN